MAPLEPIALLGFLPWRDPARSLTVRENPAILAVVRAAGRLRAHGLSVAAVAVPVTDAGVVGAARLAQRLEARLVVACGQTSTEPRVERFGRVPPRSAPATPAEVAPWMLAPDAERVAALLNRHAHPAAGLPPFRASDDAGGYFCDQLCVELARLSRHRPVRARFVHLPKVDGCAPALRQARIEQYARQLVALVEHFA